MITMQLTKEQVRARYFACYIGSNVKCYVASGMLGAVDIDDYFVRIFYDVNNCIDISVHLSSCQLLLLPLSAITDEDAVDVAKILAGDSFSKNQNYTPFIERKDDRIRIWTGGYGIADIYFNGWAETNLESSANSNNTVSTSDLLRSRGYHTGKFMGYDPIEEGWCIVDDKNGTA